jgi:hypothetical protein
MGVECSMHGKHEKYVENFTKKAEIGSRDKVSDLC